MSDDRKDSDDPAHQTMPPELRPFARPVPPQRLVAPENEAAFKAAIDALRLLNGGPNADPFYVDPEEGPCVRWPEGSRERQGVRFDSLARRRGNRAIGGAGQGRHRRRRTSAHRPRSRRGGRHPPVPRGAPRGAGWRAGQRACRAGRRRRDTRRGHASWAGRAARCAGEPLGEGNSRRGRARERPALVARAARTDGGRGRGPGREPEPDDDGHPPAASSEHGDDCRRNRGRGRRHRRVGSRGATVPGEPRSRPRADLERGGARRSSHPFAPAERARAGVGHGIAQRRRPPGVTTSRTERRARAGEPAPGPEATAEGRRPPRRNADRPGPRGDAPIERSAGGPSSDPSGAARAVIGAGGSRLDP